VIASGFSRDSKAFDAVRANTEMHPGTRNLHGNYTYMLAAYTETQLREMGPSFTGARPSTTIRCRPCGPAPWPQLWISGGEDYEAPSAETGRRIKSHECEAARPVHLGCHCYRQRPDTLE